MLTIHLKFINKKNNIHQITLYILSIFESILKIKDGKIISCFKKIGNVLK